MYHLKVYLFICLSIDTSFVKIALQECAQGD